MLGKGYKEIFRMMKKFLILLMVATFIKTHQPVHLKWVHFII